MSSIMVSSMQSTTGALLSLPSRWWMLENLSARFNWGCMNYIIKTGKWIERRQKNGKKLLSIHVYDISICMQKIYTFFLITQILHVGTVSAIIGRFYVNTSNIIITKNQKLLCISYENVQLKKKLWFHLKTSNDYFPEKGGAHQGNIFTVNAAVLFWHQFNNFGSVLNQAFVRYLRWCRAQRS